MAPVEVDKKGIPVKYFMGNTNIPIMYATFNTVFAGVGQAIAWSVYSFGTTAKFDAKIATLAANGLGWLYCSVVAIRVAFIGASVMLGTSRQASKIALPDQHIYKMHGADDKGYVLMENEGVHGTFNRAQRALQNMNEATPQVFAALLLAGFVFPFPAFCLACLWGMARLVGMKGYLHGTDDRMGGNIVSMFVYNGLEGLVLIAGVKAIMMEK